MPIIRILLKRSISAEQALSMNITDFERAGVARKSAHKFSIVFVKGRVDNVIISSNLAKDLAHLLLDDVVIKDLFMKNDYHISMNSKFQLAIKCVLQPQVVEEVAEPEVAEAV